MSDEDRAQELELMEWERINRSRQVQVKYGPDDHGYGPAECVNCDAEMPVQRREYGFDLCVACKTAAESAGKHYRL